MNNQLRIAFFLLISLTFSSFCIANVRVGIARKVITPKSPAWLSGYAGREKPATGVIHDLWAKALVIEENEKSRVIIVTTDILGLSHEISVDVANQIIKKFGINRSQLLLNSSHTHSGPMIWPALSGIADYSPQEQQQVSEYSRKLTEDLVNLITDAVSNLKPMSLSYGSGSADFAINRRAKRFKNNTDPSKVPVDHDVPVLKVTSPDGSLKAVLFGYACHNTTVIGDNYLVNGDYAGFAQIEIEKMNPGATAMFMTGCAGDQNPFPRGTIALAGQHGKSLANAVQKVLDDNLTPVRTPIRTSFVVTQLEFKPFDLQSYQKDIQGTNKFLQRRAVLMLEAYNKGWDVSKYPYPVQAVRFGNDFTILAMAGEVVVDYSLMMKKLYPKENLFVAAYSNEVMCYIPTKRILDERGYEAVDNMIYYSMPGPFSDNVEEIVFKALHQVMKEVGGSLKK